MANPITNHNRYLEELKSASEALAKANGLLVLDPILRDSHDQPLELGGANTNAIAHALTSAYLAYDHSLAGAAILGEAREHRSYWLDPKRPAAWDTFKDLYNNQVGRNIAEYVRRNNLSRDQIQDLILDALSSGKLIVTQKDPRIDPTFNGNPFKFLVPKGDAAPWTTPSAGFPDFAPSVTRVPIGSSYEPSGQALPSPASANGPNLFDDRIRKWGSAPIGIAPMPALDGPASFDSRFGNWGSTYAGGDGGRNLPPPMVPPAFVGPGIPFVSTPAGSLATPGGSSLLDSAPMDPEAPGSFSNGGRFVPRSSSPRPLYPTGALTPASNGRVQDRQGSLDDHSGNLSSSLVEETDRYRSPALRELQRHSQLAASGAAAAPSSAAFNPGIPLASSAGSGTGASWGGVLKWIGNGLIGSAEASQPILLPQDGTVRGFVGENDASIPDVIAAASPSSPDNRRYLSRRTASQASAFDTGAPATPFVPSNEGLSFDRSASFDNRFGSWPSTQGVTQPGLQQQAARPLGLFSGQPMPDWPVPPPIFVLPDPANAPDNDGWFKFVAGLAR